MKTVVIIPALNEEASIAGVVTAIPRASVSEVLVIDNRSIDNTASVARAAGATVVYEPVRGYGTACLRGLLALPEAVECVVFLDADLADRPEELPRLIAPIASDEADLVIGSRTLGERERGALTPQAFFGNKLACWLIRLLWRHRYTDLGPFRALRTSTLRRLRLCDRDFGWTVEMQVRALQEGLRVTEVAVPYRRRVGKSKISGTVSGTVRAGYKILTTIGLLYWRYKRGRRTPRTPERK